MHFYTIMIDYIPKAFVVGLWVNFTLNQTYLWLAIGVTIYTLLLYLASQPNNGKNVDGFIEVSERETGEQLWKLVLEQDPEELKDKDKLIFQFKTVA